MSKGMLLQLIDIIVREVKSASCMCICCGLLHQSISSGVYIATYSYMYQQISRFTMGIVTVLLYQSTIQYYTDDIIAITCLADMQTQ